MLLISHLQCPKTYVNNDVKKTNNKKPSHYLS